MTRSATSPQALAQWIREQRWFDRSDVGADVALGDPVPLPGEPSTGLQLAETARGDRYQLVVSLDPTPVKARTTSIDRAAEPTVARALVRLAADATSTESSVGTLTGHWLGGEPAPGAAEARPLGGEQSNTSVVVGGTHVLKVFRRLGPGTNPEVEIGRHLHAVGRATDGAPLPVAPLSGWYELREGSQVTTLGVVNRLVPGALDGWSLTLSALAADPTQMLHRLRDLGVAVARLHAALARPAAAPTAGDPDADRFGSAPLEGTRVSQIVRSTAAELDRIRADVPPATFARVSERIEARAAAVDQGDLGSAIRTHGDLHLGQTVVGPDGWVILDFEGEPARSLEERRHHHSPLRDVAGLLRSLSYAAETVRRSGAGPVTEGWEPAARAAVLDGYLATVEPGLLPRSTPAVRGLLDLFEVEKAVYEVSYELAHRPDWVHLPLGALERTR